MNLFKSSVFFYLQGKIQKSSSKQSEKGSEQSKDRENIRISFVDFSFFFVYEKRKRQKAPF